MAVDSRVQELLGELADSECTPEEVCAACPELLSEVRRRWLQMCALKEDLDSLFPQPESGTDDDNLVSGYTSAELPQIPGYEVVALLGRGGMGLVYKARHLRLNRFVALKMLITGAYAGPQERGRFQREAEAVASLRHAHIVQVHDVGDHEGWPYFTMELLEGGSLSQALAGMPQPARHAAALVATLAEAMQAAHRGGIVHRDLKPANILFTSDGTAKVADFGLARHFDVEPALTLSGCRVGTPSYMAPEQVIGKAETIGPAADIYALGVLLYEMLTGRPPFRGETASETEQQVIHDEPISPSRLNTKVPRDLETICLKCLQKAPQHRYATALELAEDLHRYQRGEPIAARPVSRPERIVRWVRRNPTAAALILAALALLGLAIASGVSRWRLEARRRAEIVKWTPRLDLVKQLESNGQFQEARAILQRMPDVDVGELNDRIHAALEELDLAQKLERIRLDRAAVVDGRFDLDFNQARSDRDYEAALGEGAVIGLHDAPVVAAVRVRASPIRRALVAALDDWALCTKVESRRASILEIARLADPDPTGWRDRVRNPILSRDALTELAESAAVREQSVQLLVALGQRMQAEGADPIAFLRRVQQQYPGDFWANLTLADALLEKNPGECIRYHQAALAIRPESAVAHHNVGRALAYAYRIDDAIKHFREAVKLDPKFAHAVSNLGKALSMKGQNVEALELSKQAVVLDERSAKYRNNLGFVLEMMGRTSEAIDEYRRSMALDPDFTAARVSLGNAFTNSRRFGEAMETFTSGLRAKPKDAWLHLGFGRALYYSSRYDEAIAEFEAATRLDSELFHAHSMLGDCWRQKQSMQKALLEYNKAIALRPDDSLNIQARRGVMVQLGLGDLARAEWENALKARPPEHSVWYGYAELCLYLDHQDEYERACHELLGRFESSPDPLVCARTGTACLLGRIGPDDSARAVALVERAGKVDPTRLPAGTRPYLRLAQGLARYRCEDFDSAVRAIDESALAANGALPHLVLAMAQGRLNRADEALRRFVAGMRANYWRTARIDTHDDWVYHTLCREARRVVTPKLTAFLDGTYQPQGDAERLAYLEASRFTNRAAATARRYADALSAAPDSADDLRAAHRYYAACAAARAGSGIGDDDVSLDEAERARWRRQAREWLRADLELRTKLLDDASAVGLSLSTWQADPSLAGVRDAPALAKLTPDERGDWQHLWADVEALRAAAPAEKVRALAAQRDWARAADLYAQALKRGATNGSHFWYEYAALSLLSGDRAEYSRACAQLVERCGKPNGPRAYLVARACTLAADSVADAGAPARLADKELQDFGREFWALTERGALAYRDGRHEDAVTLFERSLKADPKPGRALLNWLWLAIAHHRLGNDEDSQRWLNMAQTWLDQGGKAMSDRLEDEIGLHLHNWLEAHVLRREAEALISSK
jgi:serine/threonine-protein kinase